MVKWNHVKAVLNRLTNSWTTSEVHGSLNRAWKKTGIYLQHNFMWRSRFLTLLLNRAGVDMVNQQCQKQSTNAINSWRDLVHFHIRHTHKVQKQVSEHEVLDFVRWLKEVGDSNCQCSTQQVFAGSSIYLIRPLFQLKIWKHIMLWPVTHMILSMIREKTWYRWWYHRSRHSPGWT